MKTFLYVLITNFVFAETDEVVVKRNVCVNIAPIFPPCWGTSRAEDIYWQGAHEALFKKQVQGRQPVSDDSDSVSPSRVDVMVNMWWLPFAFSCKLLSGMRHTWNPRWCEEDCRRWDNLYCTIGWRRLSFTCIVNMKWHRVLDWKPYSDRTLCPTLWVRKIKLQFPHKCYHQSYTQSEISNAWTRSFGWFLLTGVHWFISLFNFGRPRHQMLYIYYILLTTFVREPLC